MKAEEEEGMGKTGGEICFLFFKKELKVNNNNKISIAAKKITEPLPNIS
jgi:hypothetical protein